MKIAFDVHGVLDTFKYYRELADLLYESGHEVIVLSGQLYDDQMKAFLDDNRIRFHEYFSVTQYLIDSGYVVQWRCGQPFAADEVWNPTKAKICVDENIDVLYDDSYIYKDTFNEIATIYNHVINPHRKQYKVRCSDDVA